MTTTAQPAVPARANVDALLSEVSRREKDVLAYLPPGASASRFMAIARHAIQQQPKLAECSANSVLRALGECAASGLPLDGHYSSLIIRRSKEGRSQACWDPSAHGMTQLALESGYVLSVDSDVVREHDEYRVERGSAPMLHHAPLLVGDRGTMIFAYAVVTLASGVKQIELLTLDIIERIKAQSPASEKGPWRDWPDEMARKSAVRRALKRLPAGVTRRTGRLPDDSTDVLAAASLRAPSSASNLMPEETFALECRALEQLSAAATVAELDAAWALARLEHQQRGADVPNSVHARWTELREAMESAG